VRNSRGCDPHGHRLAPLEGRPVARAPRPRIACPARPGTPRAIDAAKVSTANDRLAQRSPRTRARARPSVFWRYPRSIVWRRGKAAAGALGHLVRAVCVLEHRATRTRRKRRKVAELERWTRDRVWQGWIRTRLPHHDRRRPRSFITCAAPQSDGSESERGAEFGRR
jgi:hypothetical protein